METVTAINKNKADAAACMVEGCDRKALYKNAISARDGCKRGYCSAHRQMAVTKLTTSEAVVDGLMRRLGL